MYDLCVGLCTGMQACRGRGMLGAGVQVYVSCLVWSLTTSQALCKGSARC